MTRRVLRLIEFLFWKMSSEWPHDLEVLLKLRGRGTVKGYSGIVLETEHAFNAHTKLVYQVLSPVPCTVQIFFLTLRPHLPNCFCCLSSWAFFLAPLFLTLLSTLLFLSSAHALLSPLKSTPSEASPYISHVPFRSPGIRSSGIILLPWLLSQYWTQPHVLFPVLSIFWQVSLLQIWLKWTLFLPILLQQHFS